jgi:hypothetical protein
MPYFYDSHCHMMNLSHPNLSAIIKRTFNDLKRDQLKRYILYFKLALLMLFLVIPVVVIALLVVDQFDVIKWSLGIVSVIALGFFVFLMVKFFNPESREKTFSQIMEKIKEKLGNVMNLLAIMETDIGDCLIQMEEDLRKNMRKNFPLSGGLVISENGEKYEKIVLTPLIMDFGLKDSGNSNLPYKVRWKPIVAQVEDLCIGIRDYYVHRDAYIEPEFGPTQPLFQIIPFMGINTKNYDSQKSITNGKNVSVSLNKLLEKNFSEFKKDEKPQMRRAKFDAVKWEEFNGNVDSIDSHYFMGIKVYPPLGFDPWPEAGPERDKVICLYDYCIECNIPITAHCSPGGFLVDKAYKDFASPYTWEKVLKHQKYRNLRLNLAHYGGVEDDSWRNKITEMILETDPETGRFKYENFYTDISYQGVDRKAYDNLLSFLNTYDSAKRSRIIERIIFGTDFMINLQDISTYSKYLDFFFKTEAFTLEEKDMLCNKNSERFLYVG